LGQTDREIIHTDHAPAAVGPYSQAVVSGGFLFSAGQIALNPKTGELVSNDVATQTRQVLENLQAVLGAAGLDLGDVVKTTIFLTSMDDFATVNAVYKEAFGEDSPPARSTVAVSGLPLGADVEIDVVARVR